MTYVVFDEQAEWSWKNAHPKVLDCEDQMPNDVQDKEQANESSKVH